jgi:DNA polymerase (family X)
MKNKEIAQLFREIATLLVLDGANPFRIRAYEKAAQTLENIDGSIEEVAAAQKLTALPAIGKDLSEKIKEYIDTGKILFLDELKNKVPAGLSEMLQIQGLGPKTVKYLHDQLFIDSIDMLREYARAGKLKQLDGIKEKTEENILRGIELYRKTAESVQFHIAQEIAQGIRDHLSKLPHIKNIELAGSLRRKKATVKDIDILATSSQPQAVMEAFLKMPAVKEVIARGDTKSSVIVDRAMMQVDLRVVPQSSFAAALIYFTGSKEFNVRLRSLAAAKNYKINEYGVFPKKTSNQSPALKFKSEADIFSFMGMSYIEPELREDRGEIEAAAAGKLPSLLTRQNIRGDLHVHSTYSDGLNTIEEMANAAKEAGYEYLGVADHSPSLRVAGGLSPEDLRKKIAEIRKINQKIKGIKILCSSEVDILSDGRLDYPDNLLKELDYVIAAVHTSFKQPSRLLTKRIVTACRNKYVNIIAHPTGFLRGSREAYDIDLDEVFKAAVDHNVALEINSHPHRLDLNDDNSFKAKRAGVKLSINTDSHNREDFDLIQYGVNIARRAWLEPADVINCLGLKGLLKWLDKQG